MTICAHHKSLANPCADCLREELAKERRGVKAWKEIAARRSAERDEAQRFLREALDELAKANVLVSPSWATSAHHAAEEKKGKR